MSAWVQWYSYWLNVIYSVPRSLMLCIQGNNLINPCIQLKRNKWDLTSLDLPGESKRLTKCRQLLHSLSLWAIGAVCSDGFLFLLARTPDSWWANGEWKPADRGHVRQSCSGMSVEATWLMVWIASDCGLDVDRNPPVQYTCVLMFVSIGFIKLLL